MIGLILPTNPKFAPYVKGYVSILENNKIPYEIIMWDKKKTEELGPAVYRSRINTTDRISWRKIACYIGYITFLRKRIKKCHYDKLVVFTAVPAIMVSDILIKKYPQKYILDIRDDTVLRRFASGRIRKIACTAKYLVASSPFYFKWLGREGMLDHNADEKMIERKKIYSPIPQNKTGLCIMCAGMMREADINSRLLSRLSTDGRLKFVFYGPMNAQLQRLKETYGEAENVVFPGIYNKEDIYDIYRSQADLINVLRSENTVNAEALPNKLYEAVIAGVPVIVFAHNTAVAEIVERYYLGLIIHDWNELETASSILRLVKEFDFDKYKRGRIEFLNCVSKDNTNFKNTVSSFFVEGV